MINTIFFSINIILGIIVWKYMLRLSILDNYRDKLFDLREEVRRFYITNEISLNHPTYRSIRGLLNSHLRFIEKMSFSQVICFSSIIDKNEELKNHIKRQLDSQFNTDNDALSSFLRKTRDRSSLILLNYMIFSSPLLIIMFLLIAICYIPVAIVRFFLSNIKNEVSLLGQSMKIALNFIKKFIASQNDLEKFSYESEQNIFNMA